MAISRQVRRKPVPNELLDGSSSSAPPPSPQPKGTIRKLSLRIINKDMPPLPSDWRETIDHAVKRERRYAVYVSAPSITPSNDDEFVVGSRRESLAITLVEEQEESTPAVPPHNDSAPIESVEVIEATPPIVRRLSQKSTQQIHPRPPTPPLPSAYPKLRSVTRSHSRASSVSLTRTLYMGQTAERIRATPSQSMLASRPNTPGLDFSMTAHSPDSRSRVLSFNSSLPKQRGEASPSARRQSAAFRTSVSTGSRSFSGRSQFTCHMCNSVWYALKAFGIHLRARMIHRTKYLN